MRSAILYFILILIDAQVAHGEPLCVSPTFSHRTGRENCWAEFSLNLEKKLCVSKKAWINWLHSKIPYRICAQSEGYWKTIAPLINSEHDSSSKKKTMWKVQKIDSLSRFRAHLSHLEYSGPELGWALAWQKVEIIRERLSLHITPNDPTGVLRNLILDEKTPNSAVPVLRILGFVHLATASGIHLYALSAWAGWLVMRASRHLGISAQYGVRIQNRVFFLLSVWTWLLSGARLGLLRPWVVLLTKQIALSQGFKWRRIYPLLFALGFEFMISCFCYLSGRGSFFHGGRWIYALAVGGGMLWYSCFRSAHLGLAVGSWILVAIWEAWTEGTVAIGTALISLVTLPLFCIFLFPPVALASLISVAPLLESLGKLFSYMILNLSRLALLPGNLWTVSRSALLAGIVIGFFSLYVRGSKRNLGFIVLLLIFIRGLQHFAFFQTHTKAMPLPRADQLTQLDVGQGDSALVSYVDEHHRRWGFIDVGSAHSLKDGAWLRILSERGISEIAWVALTHLDEDHAGGLIRLGRLVPIQCVVTSDSSLKSKRGQKLIGLLEHYKIPVRSWASSCIPFPNTDLSDLSESKRANSDMHAILVPLFPRGYYLSAGDASERYEEKLLGQSWPFNFAKDQTPRILKISHHGSKSSSSARLIQALQPTEAWISVGTSNRYGHPSPQVLTKLRTGGIRHIRRTDETGRLTFRSSLNLPKPADDHRRLPEFRQ